MNLFEQQMKRMKSLMNIKEYDVNCDLNEEEVEETNEELNLSDNKIEEMEENSESAEGIDKQSFA
jgi:hypothetical protein